MPESASAATPSTSRRRLSISSYTADPSMACRDHVLTKDFRVLERNFLALQERVRTLEANLAAGVRQGTTTSGIAGDMTGDARGTASPPHLASSPITSRRHLADDEMVYALEDFQMSNRINALRNLGNADAKTMRVESVESSPSNITADHPLSFIIPTSTDYLAQALSLLPDQQTCQLLVQRYFDKVEWFQRVRHRVDLLPVPVLLTDDGAVSSLPYIHTPMPPVLGRPDCTLGRLCVHLSHGHLPRVVHH